MPGYSVFRGWTPPEGAAEVCSTFRPDVVVVQAGTPVPLARAFDGLNVPTVVYLRDVEFQQLGGNPRIELQRTAFIANSRFTAARARERLGIRAEVIPPLVDHGAFATKTRRHAITLINPEPIKGGIIALELAADRPDIPFELIESWPSNRRLVELMARAGSLPNVRWRRPINHPRKIYRNTRILIAPSQWEEAWGRVVNEAQASGIPVIASHIGGLPESVGAGGSLVSPHDDVSAWKKAVYALWDDPREYARLSAAARENILRRELQPDYLLDQLLQVLSRVVSGTRAVG
jgi:glycosyltransferase involved in cell wall biosynthesis